MAVKSGELADYFTTARSFDQDRVAAAETSRRFAWVVASAACVLAGCAVLGVAALSPLKTVEPFVVRVDNATGVVDVVSGLSDAVGTYDEKVTKFFAAGYVRAREGFTFAESESNFRAATLMSVPNEQARFAASYRGGNPDSPQVIYGRSGTSKIQIKSISLLNKSVASVRYARVSSRGEEVRTTHWVATLNFSYANAPMAESDRLVNPLGFVVAEYRSDPEQVQ